MRTASGRRRRSRAWSPGTGARVKSGSSIDGPDMNVEFRPASRYTETGSSLILALVFLVTIALVISALASWTTNNLNNTRTFQYNTSELYAASGATQVAVRASRYTYPTNTSSLGYVCPGTDTPQNLNGVAIQDWCVTTPYVSTTVTRRLTITACLMPSIASSLTGPCQVGETTVPPVLTAVVDFNDNTTAVNPATPNCTSTSNQSTCGAAMTVVSWVVK